MGEVEADLAPGQRGKSAFSSAAGAPEASTTRSNSHIVQPARRSGGSREVSEVGPQADGSRFGADGCAVQAAGLLGACRLCRHGMMPQFIRAWPIGQLEELARTSCARSRGRGGPQFNPCALWPGVFPAHGHPENLLRHGHAPGRHLRPGAAKNSPLSRRPGPREIFNVLTPINEFRPGIRPQIPGDEQRADNSPSDQGTRGRPYHAAKRRTGAPLLPVFPFRLAGVRGGSSPSRRRDPRRAEPLLARRSVCFPVLPAPSHAGRPRP